MKNNTKRPKLGNRPILLIRIEQKFRQKCFTVVLHLKWNTVFRFLKFYMKVTSHSGNIIKHKILRMLKFNPITDFMKT